MPTRPPIDVSQFRTDVDEALAAFLVDPAYAVKMAKRANQLLRIRERVAALKAAREVEMTAA